MNNSEYECHIFDFNFNTEVKQCSKPKTYYLQFVILCAKSVIGTNDNVSAQNFFFEKCKIEFNFYE